MNKVNLNLNPSMAGLDPSSAISRTTQLQALKAALKGLPSYEVLSLFLHGAKSDGLPHPELLSRTKFVSLDAEWWQFEHINNNITELGLTIVDGEQLKENGTDIKKTLLNAEAYHFRPIETCHLRNQDLNKDSELHSLYAHTRFAERDVIKTKLEEILDCDVPVILVGQNLIGSDLPKLKKQWGVDVHKMDSVVHIIDSVTGLARKMGIHDRVDAEVPKPGSLMTLLEAFGIHPRWIHNAVNDSMHTMLPVILLAFYPDLYPDDSSDYPKDSSVRGESLDDILVVVGRTLLARNPPAIGCAMYCFYCDTANEHEAYKCKNRSKLPPCYYCANAPSGGVNAEFRKRAKQHRTHRCSYEHLHEIPDFPDYFYANLDKKDMMTLSRAMFARDFTTVGELFFKGLGGGRMGDRQVMQWMQEGSLPADEDDSMIPGYETDIEWQKGLEEKAKMEKQAELKKFKKKKKDKGESKGEGKEQVPQEAKMGEAELKKPLHE